MPIKFLARLILRKEIAEDRRHFENMIHIKNKTIAELQAARDEANADFRAVMDLLKKEARG